MCHNHCIHWDDVNERCTGRFKGLYPCEEDACDAGLAQTDYLCPQCQLAGLDGNYLYEATDEEGNETYHCPVCEKTYPLPEWVALMAQAYAIGLDERDDLRSDKLALEYELRSVRRLLGDALDTARSERPAALHARMAHGVQIWRR